MNSQRQPGDVGRFYGKYRAKVRENLDPLSLGRIIAEVPLVPAATTWALPCTPYAGPGVGFYAIPPLGADVWVEFEGGDPDYPIWTGCFWTAPPFPLMVPERKVFQTEFLTMTLDDLPAEGGYTIEYFMLGEMDAPFRIKISMAGITLSAPPALQTLISEEGITLEYPPTTVALTAETASIEAPDVSITSEAATEINAGADVTVDAGAELSLTAGAALEVSAGAELSLAAGAAVEVSAGADLSMEAALAVEVSAGLDVSVEAVAAFNVQAADAAITAAAVEVTGAAIALSGAVEVTGDELLDGNQVMVVP